MFITPERFMFQAIRNLLSVVAAVTAITLIPLTAVAQTTTDFSTGTANNGARMSPGIGSGQTFTVPANVSRLVSISLGVSQTAGGAQNYDLKLYRISGNTVGALLETSAQTISAAAAFPTYELDVLPLSGAGLAVVPGETFLIIGSTPTSVAAFAAYRNADPYSGGSYYDNAGGVLTGREGFFRAVYTDAASPTPVPTLSEWAMILFGLLLAGGAALLIQRRRFLA